MTEEKKPRVKIPKVPAAVGAAIDALMKMRREREAAEAKVNGVKAIESAFEEAIFAKFEKAKLQGARGKIAQATIERRTSATIEDYNALIKHIKKTGDFDLFQRRVSGPACRERWGAGKTIPGVGTFTSVRLALTTVKKR
jgi:hypothetical protein